MVRSQSYQTFFSPFFFFGVKLGHFTINNFFLYVMKTQAYQQKKRKNSLLEKKKSLVGLTPGANLIKLFFFANKEFFCFLLVSLYVY